MRILILGGNGFIGSHLAAALLKRGDKLRIVDRAIKSFQLQHPAIDYRMADCLDFTATAEALQDIDIVYHLMSTSVPSTSNLDPVADINGNLIPTVRLLQQMVDLNVRRIVFMSSGGTVYGNPTLEPVPETHPLNPICSYGVIKASIEKYLMMFKELYNLQPLIIRPSNLFGPRQGHIGVQGVIPTFMKRIMDGEPITVYGDGSIGRDYIYIDDLIAFCLLAGSSNIFGIYNVGGGNCYSLNDIIHILENVMGQKAKVEYKSKRNFDVQRVSLDIRKARDDFDWQPVIKIEDGIRQYWHWLNNISCK